MWESFHSEVFAENTKWERFKILKKLSGRNTKLLGVCESQAQFYTEKNLLVSFTFFIRKFIIFIVTLGHTQNVGFLLF